MHAILVAGGAGFVGGEFVRQWSAEEASAVVNLDQLTYPGNQDSLATIVRVKKSIAVCDGGLGRDDHSVEDTRH